MPSDIRASDLKILCARSGNHCALPNCHKILVEGETAHDVAEFVGFIAHIVGKNPGSARYSDTMAPQEKRRHDNLILVCGSCHKIIDGQKNTYTVEELCRIKTEHEEWIRSSTEREMPNITFLELDLITKYLVSAQDQEAGSYVLTPPKEKILKNKLSSTTESLITTGLVQVKQVGEFIDKSPDMLFGSRLKVGFVQKYNRLRSEGLNGDDLFAAMFSFYRWKQR